MHSEWIEEVDSLKKRKREKKVLTISQHVIGNRWGLESSNHQILDMLL